MSKNSFKIKNFLKAKSPVRLRQLMYEKQLQMQMTSLHFDIVSHKGELYAWYDEILDTNKMREMDNVNEPTK